ncbi:hypothetical protein AB0J74_18925 [Asanoa sp. NPDC049573]|uniref:hypothetical protein n=1 Tax=Asanoa sp. NPDC049573 TaxID=3155396 RepID=UPI0034240EC7
MTTVGTVQVVHALATSGHVDLPDHESWPEIARCLVAFGGHWPAAIDLAALSTASPAQVDEAVARLAEQTGRELGERPAPHFWDTVCGLVARSWRLGLFTERDATCCMNRIWYEIRDLDRSASQDLQIIWQGMGLWELDEHSDQSRAMVDLLIGADRLIPADAVDGPTCKAVLDAIG